MTGSITCVLVLLLAACTGKSGAPTASVEPATPCDQIVEGCTAQRGPDIVLRSGASDGALQPVDGMDLTGIITADQALKRAWHASSHAEASSVQVTLGAADASSLGWGPDTGETLYYAVRWSGLCTPGSSPSGESASASSCGSTEWGTIIDARSGAFVVDGI